MTIDGAVDDPVPDLGAKQTALAGEQQHLDRVHDRVEQLRRRARRRVELANADTSGSTFQEQFERDVTAHHHAARVERFTVGDLESLAFGRIDLVDRETLHVGKTSVIGEGGEVLLVDWRAPAAGAFYRATAADPHGVARRRTLTTRGPRVIDLDDEIIDATAAETLGLRAVTGQGALLAALTRDRRPRMQDIVATIAEDQDRIIRAPARGTLVVTGGPGTGKTVVALHRVAYLMYRDRNRFEGRGVLVVGPSRAFTAYTARVLPGLGEDRAVQRSIGAIGTRPVATEEWDPAEVGAVKGSLAMAEVCRRLLVGGIPPIVEDLTVSVDGVTASVAARVLTDVRNRHLRTVRPRPGRSYTERAEPANQALDALVWDAWCTACAAQGRRVPESPGDIGFFPALHATARMIMLRRTYWPDIDPESLLSRLARGDPELAELAGDLLAPDAIRHLTGGWDTGSGWRVDDVPLLDELAALVGDPDAHPPGTSDTASGGEGEVPSQRPNIESPNYRDFAHVVVDEAQDLTPMQWRVLARQAPYASWTVVGDLAQRTRTGTPEDWAEIAGHIGRRQVDVHELDLNYRTPAEIAAVGRRVLADAGAPEGSHVESIRETGIPARLVTTREVEDTVVEIVRRSMSAHGGTCAVIVPREGLDGMASAVRSGDSGAAGRMWVLEPRTAKGLEFDDVVVVNPDVIARDGPAGVQQLYVSVTRATRSLTVVADPGVSFPGRAELSHVGDPEWGAPDQSFPAATTGRKDTTPDAPRRSSR